MMWLLGGIAVIVVLAVMIYNRLVSLRQTYKNAFADIDVQLKLRYDLVPNLVETVKGYAAHESGIFQRVTEARAAVGQSHSLPERNVAEAQLSGALTQLLAVAENYPDLKANQNFQQLQMELSDVENKIAASRRFFNNAVAEYNAAIEQFPAVLIASRFGFTASPMFELDAGEKAAVHQAPKISFGG